MAYLDAKTRLGPGGSPRMPVAFTARDAAVATGDGSLGRLSAGLYGGTTGAVTTLGKLGKP